MTKDLLQQAIDALSPQGRTEINNALAFIQNGRNMRHADEFCPLPYSDLEYAVTRLAEVELRNEGMYWDLETSVKGLA